MLKYIDKGTGRTLILLPGWGFHPEIIDFKRLHYDLLLPQRPILIENIDFLVEEIRSIGMEKTNILGWSLGARIAMEAVNHVPSIFSKMILVSLPAPFDDTTIKFKLSQLEKDQKKALKGFYLTVFQDDLKAYKLFKKRVEHKCLSFWTKEELVQGLKILGQPLPKILDKKELLLIHGEYDSLCPVNRLPKLKDSKKQKKILLSCGHIPFMEDAFYNAVNTF